MFWILFSAFKSVFDTFSCSQGCSGHKSALRASEVSKGEKVLVIGASGGCGLFGVQIAKLLGAEVTGIASAVNFNPVRERGADYLVNYQDAESMLDLQRRGRYFNKIYDTVSSFEEVTEAPGAERRVLEFFCFVTEGNS